MITIENIKRETEKALLIEVEIESAAIRITKEVWFPKSQVKIEDGKLSCPAWLQKAKLLDITGSEAGYWFN